MFGLLKEFFSPKTALGLQIDGGSIRAVQVSNPTKSPTLQRLLYHEIEDPETLGQELQEFFRKEKLKPEMLITSLPTAQAVVREIDIPLDNLKKLDKIIKYQMEPYVPYPIENMVADYFPAEPNRPIMVLGVLKERLSEHLNTLSQAGLESDVVTFEDAALAFLSIHVYPGKKDAPFSIVHFKGKEMIVQVILRGRPEITRTLQSGSGGLDRLKETLVLYQLKSHGEPVAEVLITGPDAADSSLVERIEAHTGIKTVFWRPFDHIKNGLGEIDPDLQAKFSVPLALAVGMTNASPKNLDLRKEEFSLKTSSDLKNMLIYALSAIIVLTGLFTFRLYYDLSIWESRYETRNKRLKQVL